MTSKRRYKYLRALRHILVASLMMASFYVGRWSIHWEFTNLAASVAYIVTVLVYFRLELREHRRDSEEFRRFLRECEEMVKLSTRTETDKIYEFSYRCPKCGKASLYPIDPDDCCAACHEVMQKSHLDLDEAYGYRSYTCPKCGRLSHLPVEVEPYCIECLAEFEKSDWRG